MMEEPSIHPSVLVDVKISRKGESNPPVFLVSKKKKYRVFSYCTSAVAKSLLVILVLIVVSLRGLVVAPTIVLSQDYTQERSALEAQLADLEKQIAAHQATIEQYQKQGKSLSSEIKLLNAQIAKLNLQIKAVNVSISSLDGEITQAEGAIGKTETQIGFEKEALSTALQRVYEGENRTVFQAMLENPHLSDFFGDLNNLVLVQDNLNNALAEYSNLRDQYVNQKTALALQREDATALRAYQATQKSTIQETQKEKNNLLAITKGKESQYQKLLADTQAKAAEIRNRIFRLTGGGELPFGDAVKLAAVAEKATGVRAAFILAILTQESSINGVIGTNLGRCAYNDPSVNPSGTVMSDKEKPIFLALMTELHLDPEKTPVSCPIVSDGSYGGAMGPAQFMPSTWQLFADRVARITGGNPPSPFNNLDAFTGTALYLQGGLATCKTIYSAMFSQENCAAAKYYAGSAWRSYTRVGSYGYRVAERAQGFQDDIDVLNSNS
ncbi:MAG: lytic murein transglycosylase [Patescibacteria group bacterium]|nr:lytic murein transglycosylase [Patescibacteria group bacterium]MDE2438554.1 lytic murein transglycosylase [Patescibacteria group bacterium]